MDMEAKFEAWQRSSGVIRCPNRRVGEAGVTMQFASLWSEGMNIMCPECLNTQFVARHSDLWQMIDAIRPVGAAPTPMRLYVIGFLFNQARRHVVLVKKDHPEWQAGKLNAVGGKVEPGEDPAHAMIREFAEEAGVLRDIWRPFAAMQGSDWAVTCYRAFDDDAFATVRTMTPEPILRVPVRNVAVLNVIDNLRWLVPLALDRYVGREVVHVPCADNPYVEAEAVAGDPYTSRTSDGA